MIKINNLLKNVPIVGIHYAYIGTSFIENHSIIFY